MRKCAIASSLIVSFCMLTGCATLRSQATTNYSPSLQFSGKSFAFYKFKRAHQDTDMQYDFYTDMIARKLISMGMTQTNMNKADYAIMFSYIFGAGEKKIGYQAIYGQTGTQVVSSNTTGNYSGYGNFGNYSSQTTYNTKPVFGAIGTVPYVYTVYPCTIRFMIIKRKDLNRKEKPLYFATIYTVDNINAAPNIIFTSMLKGYLNIFPGQNGQTQTITTFINR